MRGCEAKTAGPAAQTGLVHLLSGDVVTDKVALRQQHKQHTSDGN